MLLRLRNIAAFITILLWSESLAATSKLKSTITDPPPVPLNKGEALSISQSVPVVTNLELGKILQRDINGDEIHNYQITLKKGQYLQVTVEQKGVDLEVILLSPDGKQLAISNSFNGANGPEPISIIAPTSGNYKLQVRRFKEDENPDSGSYEITLEALRFPNEQDRIRVAAEQAYMQGNQLALEDTQEAKQKAITKWKEAIPLYTKLGDRHTVAFILQIIGNTYPYLRDNIQSLNYYNQALLVYRDLDDAKSSAEIRKTIRDWGYLALFPEINQATILESDATQILRKEQSESLSKQAIQKFEEARLLYKKVGHKLLEANALRTLALLYFELKNFSKSLDYLSQSLQLLQEAHDTFGQTEIFYMIGQVYTEENINNFQQALDNYKQSLQLSQKIGHKSQQAKTLDSLGLIYYYYAADKTTALDYFQQSLPVSKAVGTEEEARALYHIAFVQRDLGKLTESLTNIEASLKLIEENRSEIRNERLRTLFFASKHDYYLLYIDVLMKLHKQNPKLGYDVKAFQANESARARSLLDILTEAKVNIRQGVDPELLKKEMQLQEELNSKEQSRVKLLQTQYTDKQLSELKQEIKDLIVQVSRFREEILITSPKYAAIKYPQPLTLQEIQQQVLDENTLLLEYSLGKENSYLWAVSKTSVSSYELPKDADIEAAAQEFYKQLTSEQIVNPEAGNKLSQMLLAPVANQLGKKRLLIVSDGALQSIPFAALPIPTSDGKNFTPLLVQNEVVSLPSASTLAVLRNQLKDRKPVSKTLAVIADPVFTSNDERFRNLRPQPQIISANPNEVKRSASDIGVILDRLKYTRIEAETILSLVPENQRTSAFDFAASRAIATNPELANYKIIHFATHGLLNNVNPELSGVVFSLVDEQGADSNGFLRLNDIFNLNLPAELVVLSACETGLGKDVKGEGLVGLTRGFMYAGAKRVVVSLWSVKDTATAELMKKFYRQMLAKGLHPVAALRAAQLEMWKTQQWKAPYYWAAFVVQGEWK
jgi:CHAT domain-containing protein/tetratricopeptide (TPR) repeat protein